MQLNKDRTTRWFLWIHGELSEAIGTGKRISARFVVEAGLRGGGGRDISSGNTCDTYDHPAATQKSRETVRYNNFLVGARQNRLPKVKPEYSPDSPECYKRHESGVKSLSACFQHRWRSGGQGALDIGHKLQPSSVEQYR